MGLHEEQREHLDAVARWAEKIRETLGPIQQAHAGEVHFRPGSTGVAMVGLHLERPQQGKSGLTNLDQVAREFDTVFAKHCKPQAEDRGTSDERTTRETPEKRLQSFLIADAYRNGRKLASVNAASERAGDPVDLTFVTDEIPIPDEGGEKIVCDILALRRDGGRCTPVLLELKNIRLLKRLKEQVNRYSALMDKHPQAFANLYGAILGEPVRFDGPTEKWIVWPSTGADRDPRERELAEEQIRVVGYREVGARDYSFDVGLAPKRRNS